MEPLFAPPIHADVPIIGVEPTAEVVAAELGTPGVIVNRTIGRAGARNHAAVQLTALSFLTTVLLKLEAMRSERLNSEDAAIFESLKIDIEAFLAANAISDETSTEKATNSIAKGLRRYWESEAESISGKMLNTTLFVAGVSFCAAAGAFGVSDASIVTVGALVGGKNVVDALTALAKMLPRDD